MFWCFCRCPPDKLKRIDLTANEITSIDEGAFLGLPELNELVIRENHISQLPALPETMSRIDASHNNIGSKGIHNEAFKVRTPYLQLLSRNRAQSLKADISVNIVLRCIVLV